MKELEQYLKSWDTLKLDELEKLISSWWNLESKYTNYIVPFLIEKRLTKYEEEYELS